MPACACDGLPPVHYLDEAPDDWEHHMEVVASAPWLKLRRCPTCGTFWAIDEWDKFAERVAMRLASIDDWVERAGATQPRKDLLLRSRGGTSSTECAWAGCSGHAVIGTALCVEHLWAAGIRR